MMLVDGGGGGGGGEGLAGQGRSGGGVLMMMARQAFCVVWRRCWMRSCQGTSNDFRMLVSLPIRLGGNLGLDTWHAY